MNEVGNCPDWRQCEVGYFCNSI